MPDYGLSFTFAWTLSYHESVSISYIPGPDIVKKFCIEHELDLIVRGHQVVENGYEFFADSERKLVTLFSAPNYCGEFENSGAVMSVNEGLFKVYRLILNEVWFVFNIGRVVVFIYYPQTGRDRDRKNNEQNKSMAEF